MANLLSGISAGAHQGLANLVSSKRANRQMAREQRRYENALMLELNTAAANQKNREKRFAYQKTRDEVADEQWKAQMGLREDAFEESKRVNVAAEEDRDLAHELQVSQFSESKRATAAAEEDRDLARALQASQFSETLSQRRTEFVEGTRQANAALAQRKEEHIDAVTGQNLARQLTANRDQTQANYYDDIIRLREEELNRPLTDIERQKIESEIAENEARAGYYDRMPNASGGSRSAPTLTAGQIDEGLDAMAGELVREYTDFGITPWTGTLPWTDPSGRNERGTQPEMLQKLGEQAFLRLMQRFNDPQLAELHLERLFDRMLSHGVGGDGPDFGDDMRGDIIRKHPSPTFSDREKIEDARRMFLSGWRTGLADRLTPSTPTETGTSIRDMPVERSSTNDFRNRGVR